VPRHAPVSHSRHIQRTAPGPRISPASSFDMSSRSVPRSAGDSASSASRSTPARAAATRSAAARPDGVSDSEVERPSAPGPRCTYPDSAILSTSRTVPEDVSPSTWRSRSTVGRSRKFSSAESAAAPDSGRPPASAIASAIRSAITSDRAPSRFAVWSRTPSSAKLVVQAVGATGLPRPGHGDAGPRQPGQVPAARAHDDPPGGARLTAVVAAVSDHDTGTGPPGDLPGEPLQAGVLGGAVLAVVHQRIRDQVPVEVAAEPVPHPGLGELLLAGQVLVGVLLPGRDRERALCVCCHEVLLPAGSPPPGRKQAGLSTPAGLMCDSHISRTERVGEGDLATYAKARDVRDGAVRNGQTGDRPALSRFRPGQRARARWPAPPAAGSRPRRPPPGP